MTESWIREFAERNGLEVHKRITTGSERAHFATFELTGPVQAAWSELYDKASPEQVKGGFVYLRSSDVDFKTYIGIESVWCEPTL